MIRTLAKKTTSLLVALDWTEWHPPLRMLLASAVLGTRAVPVSAAAFIKTAIRRTQNCSENSFLQMLVMLLREDGEFACFLADRGFRRTGIIALLLKQTGVKIDAVPEGLDDGDKAWLKGFPRHGLKTK